MSPAKFELKSKREARKMKHVVVLSLFILFSSLGASIFEWNFINNRAIALVFQSGGHNQRLIGGSVSDRRGKGVRADRGGAGMSEGSKRSRRRWLGKGRRVRLKVAAVRNKTSIVYKASAPCFV